MTEIRPRGKSMLAAQVMAFLAQMGTELPGGQISRNYEVRGRNPKKAKQRKDNKLKRRQKHK